MNEEDGVTCCDEWLDDPVLSIYHFYHAHSGMAPEAPSPLHRWVLQGFDYYVSLRLLWYRSRD